MRIDEGGESEFAETKIENIKEISRSNYVNFLIFFGVIILLIAEKAIINK